MKASFSYYLLRKLIGWPNFLRRLQWLSIQPLLGISTDQRVLDLGAGPMQYAIRLASAGCGFVVAADLAIRSDHAKLARKSGVMPVQANGLGLPFADQMFDRVLMSSLLHMVPDPVGLLVECRRVLKPDGYLVLSVPNHYQFIPRWLLLLQPWGRRTFGLPESPEELVARLNQQFNVGGTQGYYSRSELNALLKQGGFVIDEHIYAPNRQASILWELAILSYARWGNIAFHILYLFYPLGWILERTCKASEGSEHIVKARPINEF